MRQAARKARLFELMHLPPTFSAPDTGFTGIDELALPMLLADMCIHDQQLVLH
jgi:hypothetical protein